MIRQRELIPDFFIEFLNLRVLFKKNKSIGWWKPHYKEVVEAYGQMFIKSKSKKRFHIFSQSFGKKSYETNKNTCLTV